MKMPLSFNYDYDFKIFGLFCLYTKYIELAGQHFQVDMKMVTPDFISILRA